MVENSSLSYKLIKLGRWRTGKFRRKLKHAFIAPAAHSFRAKILKMKTDDQKFDPAFASKLLLEIAQENSLETLMRKLVDRILERPNVARVRVWLIEKGDICSTCVRRKECPDQTRCLHAVVGGSHLIAPNVEAELEYEQLTDRFSRIPLGVGVVGKIAATGRQIVLNDLDQDPGELAYIEWLKPEQIRGFNGVPI